MEEKRLVMIEQYSGITYLKLNKSQCDLLEYLYKNDYLEEDVTVVFDTNINIVEL